MERTSASLLRRGTATESSATWLEVSVPSRWRVGSITAFFCSTKLAPSPIDSLHPHSTLLLLIYYSCGM